MKDIFRVLGAHAQWVGIHIAEKLEKQAFSLNDRKGRVGPHISQPQDGASIGHDGDPVAPPGVLKTHALVLLDGKGGGHTSGDIGKGHFLLVMDVDGRVDLYLPPCLSVQFDRSCPVYRHWFPSPNFDYPRPIRP